MVQKEMLFIFLAILAVCPMQSAYAESASIHLKVIGPDEPSPFLQQLIVQVTNDSFMSYPLSKRIQASTLWIDGQSHARADHDFAGPPGLGAQNSWQGCVAIEDYLPQGLPQGRHKIQWQLGTIRSDVVHLSVPHPAPDGGSPKDRLKQVKALVDTFPEGLLRSCVEHWFTEQDGGLQNTDRVRYYVDPDVKILIPYDDVPPVPHVKGKIQVYLESPITD